MTDPSLDTGDRPLAVPDDLGDASVPGIDQSVDLGEQPSVDHPRREPRLVAEPDDPERPDQAAR